MGLDNSQKERCIFFSVGSSQYISACNKAEVDCRLRAQPTLLMYKWGRIILYGLRGRTLPESRKLSNCQESDKFEELYMAKYSSGTSRTADIGRQMITGEVEQRSSRCRL